MKKILFLTAISSLLISCGGDETETDPEVNTEPKEEVLTAPEEEYVDPLDGLRYTDDGKKWKVNPATQDGMKRVDSLVDNFSDGDYVRLGTEVKSELSTIIDNCTMKGEDHNQYHIVLHACMKESKAMKRGEVETTDNLEEFVEAYYDHFELPADSLQ